MNIYSGRFDQWDDEQVIIDYFYDFLIAFDSEDAVMTFEDRTKAGLPCKPHYHFVFKSPELSREKIRKYISKNPNLKGTFSSLKVCDDYDKALCYILKQYPIQQYVPFSDFDESKLNEYILISQNYNNNLVIFNSFKEHIDYLIEMLKKKYSYEPCRLTLVEELGEYVYDWNSNTKNKPINMPTNIKQTIVYMETKILSKKEFMKRFLIDNQCFIYDHSIKQHYPETKITQIFNNKDSAFFENSEDEQDSDSDYVSPLSIK